MRPTNEELELTGNEEITDVLLTDEEEVGCAVSTDNHADGISAQVGILRREASARSETIELRTQQRKFLWCGLKNLGNTCYINAVLQCLVAVGNVDLDGVYDGRNQVLQEFMLLARRVKNKNEQVITPSRFWRALGKADSRFNNTEPQDAHEFLLCVMDLCKESALGRMSIESCSVVCCASCGLESETEEVTQCISVEVGSAPGLTVNDALNNYFSGEDIPVERGWWCSNCDSVSAARKKFVLKSNPEVLTIHLKRFSYSDGRMAKVETEVGVPARIEQDGVTYRLSALVQHQGSRYTGHYVAKICTDTGWLLLNDHRVSSTMVEEMNWCPSTYLLFYVTHGVEKHKQKSFPVPDTSWIGRGPATSMSQGKGAETRRGSF